MVKKTPKQIAAIKKAKKTKSEDKTIKLAGMTQKQMLDAIKDNYGMGLIRYIKGQTGWSDREMYLRFTDDPVSFAEFSGEYGMLNYSGRGPDD